ncbi:hypothetical protein Ahy_B07g088266 [Arachis hypogaea]|uniref:Endonuclease/exonuclease/phosphatase domain-containing protein n=1 Tax=Arachis hypogaea TaxID=3818 RepID=A0A444YE35_ARAHY|nr:hypothetical protein Ahy_B07g088266 [Arachis hypogaea]
MVSEDPPSVETENQNGKNQDSSSGNQGNQIFPDFGAWMLVKRNFRRKKGMNNQGNIEGMIGQDLPNNQEREYEDDMPTNANGSRFITLNEEGINSSAKNSMQEEAIIASSGPEASKALIVNNKSQIIQKKVLRAGAGKNPQSGKMGPFNKVGPQGSEKGLKPNPKMIIKNPSSSLEASKSIVTVSPTKKSRETNDMEGVVMEYMRKLQREQNEAFVAMKQVATGRKGFVVRNNPLLMNASSSDSHMKIKAVRSPGKDLDRPPDESMIDSGGKKIKERDLSLGKQNASQGLIPRCNVVAGDSPILFCLNLRKEYSANFIILLEPQISGSRGVRIRNNIRFDSSFIVEANGRSGGIWCLWDSGTWKIDVLDHNSQMVHLKVVGGDSTPWLLSVVYGSPHRVNRRILWSNLRSLAGNITIHWCLLGDFNATLHDYERRGGSTNVVHSACPDFQSCISDCGLIDLGFVGWPFTWRRGNIVDRLDRGLSNLEWQLSFLEAFV